MMNGVLLWIDHILMYYKYIQSEILGRLSKYKPKVDKLIAKLSKITLIVPEGIEIQQEDNKINKKPPTIPKPFKLTKPKPRLLPEPFKIAQERYAKEVF